ncbi:MAG TPA: hypothetical protein PKG71_01390 [Candidatus Woesebacteria bacterium]|nr:hypothetical protein [Candidatus Woesebacteria bacterium]HNS94597.1 hypothetical protein [Candidatus Woesebacteria bacterium]
MHPSAIVPVNKPIFRTPLECVHAYRKLHAIPEDIPISYAGRLDPMAEGVLILLIGAANKQRRTLEHLDKAYEVEVLFGCATDTGDVLGKVTKISSTKIDVQKKVVETALSAFSGTINQRYPAYASIKVQGKPLFWWARQNRLQEIDIPTHSVHIHSIHMHQMHHITPFELRLAIRNRITSVCGDFRQEEIAKLWETKLSQVSANSRFPVYTLHVSCGSGVYMRVLAEDLGAQLGLPSLAYSIVRTKVGAYTRAECEQLVF